MILFLTFITMW